MLAVALTVRRTPTKRMRMMSKRQSPAIQSSEFHIKEETAEMELYNFQNRQEQITSKILPRRKSLYDGVDNYYLSHGHASQMYISFSDRSSAATSAAQFTGTLGHCEPDGTDHHRRESYSL